MDREDSKWGRVTVDDLVARLASLPVTHLKEGDNAFWKYENGSYFSIRITANVLDAMKTFEVREDDVFLVTYPKAGTTWMHAILRLMNHVEDIESGQKIEQHLFHEIPYLEVTWINTPDQYDIVPPTYVVCESLPSPRNIKSHLEAALLPPILRQRDQTNVKIIYVARNPKDLAVSYYYFCNGLPHFPNYTKFSDFLHDFLDNKVYGGDWFKENLYWWNRRHDPNVLFVKYEDMKKDIRSIVVQVSDFLERRLSDKLIEKIVEMSSFKYMKDNPASNPDQFGLYQGDPTKSFMRKGQVGDWKNHFTVAENEHFDAVYRTKMAGSGLIFELI